MKRNRRNFDFLALQVLSRNIGSFLSLGQGKIRSFLSLGLESSISGNIRNIFRVFFFFFTFRTPKFPSWSFVFLALESSVSRNIRKAFFEKTCEKFFFEKILKKFQSEIFLGESFESLKTCNFIEKRLQHRCFPVYIVKYLRTAFL